MSKLYLGKYEYSYDYPDLFKYDKKRVKVTLIDGSIVVGFVTDVDDKIDTDTEDDFINIHVEKVIFDNGLITSGYLSILPDLSIDGGWIKNIEIL